jgi:hypothetical protein
MPAAVMVTSAALANSVSDGVGNVFLWFCAPDLQEHRFAMSVSVFVGFSAIQDGASRDVFVFVKVIPSRSVFVGSPAFEVDGYGWCGRHGRAG